MQIANEISRWEEMHSMLTPTRDQTSQPKAAFVESTQPWTREQTCTKAHVSESVRVLCLNIFGRFEAGG